MYSLNSLFSLILCCVCFLSTFWLGCLCQYVTKRGEISEMWEICFKRCLTILFWGRWKCFERGRIWKVFYVSNLEGELVFVFILCFILFICLSFHTYVDVFFWVFQERQVYFDQDLLTLLATFRLGVLDWDLWCNWAIYCN